MRTKALIGIPVIISRKRKAVASLEVDKLTLTKMATTLLISLNQRRHRNMNHLVQLGKQLQMLSKILQPSQR